MTATPHKRINVANPTSNMSNFAKSLPIEIANSPLTNGRSYLALESDEDVSIGCVCFLHYYSINYCFRNLHQELDNNVDIAASIKALAKSVHGEAVFGDLPRPRLRSQI